MSKKILTVLAPVAAIVAFMAIPALAQAKTQLQCGANIECANGAAVIGQSINLKTQVQKKDGTKVATLECPHIEFQGKVTKNQGEDAEAQVEKTDFREQCKTLPSGGGSLETHIVVDPFILQIQQPVAKKFLVHILPDPPKTAVHFTAQIQLGGFSVATCDLSSTNVQLDGEEGSNVLKVQGEHQFTATGGASCGEVGTLEGDVTVTSGGKAVLVDETP